MINEKQLKQDIFNAIDSEAESLKNYADDIRKHPELGFEEFRLLIAWQSICLILDFQ